MKNIVSLSILSFLATTLATSMVDAQTTEPANPDLDAARQWQSAPKVAPFQAVQWQGETPEVRVNGRWYELESLNDLAADKIVSFAQMVDSENWHKRFEDDLPAVLFLMGHPAGRTVKLTLKDLDSGNVQTLDRVPMTKENRQSISKARTNNSPFDAAKLWRDGPKLAPFQGVRWRDQTPEVLVDTKWYELVSLNDLPVDKIVSYAQSVDADHWQKRFEEDLPALLILMKHEPGPTVKLTLKDLASPNVQTMEKVPMTLENRQAIQDSSVPATQPGTTGL